MPPPVAESIGSDSLIERREFGPRNRDSSRLVCGRLPRCWYGDAPFADGDHIDAEFSSSPMLAVSAASPSNRKVTRRVKLGVNGAPPMDSVSLTAPLPTAADPTQSGSAVEDVVDVVDVVDSRFLRSGLAGKLNDWRHGPNTLVNSSIVNFRTVAGNGMSSAGDGCSRT